MHRELVDASALRCTNIDAIKLVHRRCLTLRHFGYLGASLDQVLTDFGAQISIDLNDLKFNLGDLAFGLGSHAGQLTAFALETRGVAFQSRQPGDRNKVLLPKRTNTRKLLMDEVDFLFLGGRLADISFYFFLKLSSALFELRLLSAAGLLTQVKQAALRSNRARGFRAWIACTFEKNFWKNYLVTIIPFRLETGLARQQFVEAFSDDRGIRQCLGFVETDQNIACVYPITLSYAQFSNHAAGRMLNFLDARVDYHHALTHDRTRQLGGRGPTANHE